MRPAPLNPLVQSRFLDACDRAHTLQPAFHGTDIGNHASIFSRGLLIPGEKCGVRVAHGSVHGNGIYIERLRDHMSGRLSLGFNHGARKLLICVVLDDSVKLGAPEQIRSAQSVLPVTARSSNIIHVGDAMVVFDEAMVAPLFVAEIL